MAVLASFESMGVIYSGDHCWRLSMICEEPGHPQSRVVLCNLCRFRDCIVLASVIGGEYFVIFIK